MLFNTNTNAITFKLREVGLLKCKEEEEKKKNTAFGRHQVSQCVQIIAQYQKEEKNAHGSNI